MATKEKKKVEYTKQFWKSKTLWANVVFVLAGVSFYVQGELATGGALTLAAIINTVIRYYTTSPLDWNIPELMGLFKK